MAVPQNPGARAPVRPRSALARPRVESLEGRTVPALVANGLLAEYFSDATLTNRVVVRHDPAVNFNWGNSSPDSRVGADLFSARWTGLVAPRYSETYAFETRSDDGVRLWIDGRLVIGQWDDHAPTTHTGSIALEAGRRYDLKLEYYEHTGGAVARLFWASPSQAREVVPQSRLYSLVNGDNQYALTPGAMTWAAAHAEAEARGGHLVTINSADEEQWLRDRFGPSEQFWIGLSDAAAEGDFRWSGGEPLTHTNWAPGEPSTGPSDDFVTMNFGDGRQWNAQGGGTFRGIIEIPVGAVPTPTNPGGLALAGSVFTVNEGAGSVTIGIERRDGWDGRVTVDYRTVAGSATDGADFTGLSGTVVFEDGERLKTVAVPILNDDAADPDETFNLVIEGVTGGAVLLTPRAATVAIHDDETPVARLFGYGSFADPVGLTLNGTAAVFGGALRLTPDAPHQAGTAFHTAPVAVGADTSFSTRFSFQISGAFGSGGADGIAFVLQNAEAGAGAVGAPGGGLGYDGVAASLAIEFDSSQNEYDPDANHVSVLVGGDAELPLGIAPAPFDLNAGERLSAWVDYDGTTDLLAVYLSADGEKPSAPLLSHAVDLPALVGSRMCAGFGAGTGALTNVHDILDWEFAADSRLITSDGEPPPPPPPNYGGIGLAGSVLTVNEAAGSVTVGIERRDGWDGRVSIDYRTVPVSATDGADFTGVSGTAVFEAGERLKAITIPILNDPVSDPDETFNFVIDRVTGGAALLAPRTATVTILDDETPVARLFGYDSFANPTGLKLNGGAHAAGAILRLTEDAPHQAGSGFHRAPVAVTDNTSFATRFSFQVSGTFGSGGADGVVFVIQNADAGAGSLGGAGGELGYDGVGASLAIEFDSGQNEYDPDPNHVSILTDGDITVPLAMAPAPFDLNGGERLYAWVDYNGVTDILAVYLSADATKPADPILTHSMDLAALVGERMFAGFSAGTGALTNTHDVLDWEFAADSDLLPPDPGPTAVTAEMVVGGLLGPGSLDWSPDGRNLYVGELRGVVRVVRDGVILPTPVIDIQDRVNNTRDRGMLDIAIHPDLANHPYLYLLYTYDPPEVYQHVGDPLAGPDMPGNRAGRLTRVTLDAATDYTTAVPDSEVVILGRNSTWENYNGFAYSMDDLTVPPGGIRPDGTNVPDFMAMDSDSHTVGAVEFGPDGALWVTNGDGTSFNRVDPRTVRVQDVDNLSGKLMRIDPITGDGFADNPFYDGDPASNRSKVYQLGIRNSFRFAIDRLSGAVYLGEVGWSAWEEINTGPAGANFGWPYFEGSTGVSLRTVGYQDLPEAQAFYAAGTPVTPALLALSHSADGINAIVMGDVYRGSAYPARYQGNLFFNDLGQGIVRTATLDAAGRVASVETFATGHQYVVQMKVGPDGLMYFADLDNGHVGRWRIN